jgi:hypothetical protein
MSPPINIDGSSVSSITIDGTDVKEVTVGGDNVFASFTRPSQPNSGVAYWPLDSDTISSGTVSDVWGTNDGALSNGNTGQGGLPDTYTSGKSIDFAPSNSYIDVGGSFGDSLFTTAGNSFSITCWAQQNTSGQTGRMVDHAASGVMIAINDKSSNGFEVEIYDGSANAIGSGTDDTNPHHLALTYDAGNNTLEGYIDGSSFGTTSAAQPTLTRDNFYINGSGGGGSPSLPLDGLIDEIKVYNKELTASEVSNDYNTGSI